MTDRHNESHRTLTVDRQTAWKGAYFFEVTYRCRLCILDRGDSISVSRLTGGTVVYVSESNGIDLLNTWPEPFGNFEEQKPTRKNKKKTLLAATIALVFVFTIFFENISLYYSSQRSDTAQIDSPTREDVLAGIKDSELYVLDTANIVKHIHAHLTIVVQGKPVTIPTIGVDMDTMTAAPIHTHDTSGTLHIETDSTHSYTPNALDFIRLWNKGEDDLCLIFTGGEKCKVIVSINEQDASMGDALQDDDRMLVRISIPAKPVYV